MHFVQACSLHFEVILGAFLFLITRSVVEHNGLDYLRCGLCCRAGSASRAVELCVCCHTEIPHLILGIVSYLLVVELVHHNTLTTAT